jgi:hypothetical protein
LITCAASSMGYRISICRFSAATVI